MPRTRRSAKQAGTRFERVMADWLGLVLDDDTIDRMPRTGAKDKGDIANLRCRGMRIAVEVKDCARTDLPGWTEEAETERRNYSALAGVVIHKRRGRGNPADQWVTMTARELVALLRGDRDHAA